MGHSTMKTLVVVVSQCFPIAIGLLDPSVIIRVFGEVKWLESFLSVYSWKLLLPRH